MGGKTVLPIALLAWISSAGCRAVQAPVWPGPNPVLADPVAGLPGVEDGRTPLPEDGPRLRILRGPAPMEGKEDVRGMLRVDAGRVRVESLTGKSLRIEVRLPGDLPLMEPFEGAGRIVVAEDLSFERPWMSLLVTAEDGTVILGAGRLAGAEPHSMDLGRGTRIEQGPVPAGPGHVRAPAHLLIPGTPPRILEQGVTSVHPLEGGGRLHVLVEASLRLGGEESCGDVPFPYTLRLWVRESR
jgi:hypothetical protein